MTAVTTSATSNPAFKTEIVDQYLVGSPVQADAKTMTVGGTTIKTFVLLVFVVIGGAYGWAVATEPVGVDLGQGYGNTTVTIPGGFWLVSLLAFFLGIWITLQPKRAAVGGIIYSLLQGYLLGVISAAFDAQTDGIVGAAILATVCVFLVSLVAYATGLVKPTQKMAFILVSAMGGLMLLYLFVSIMAIFDWSWLYSEQFRTMGIVVTTLSIGLAALSLVLDFATIDAGVEAGAPKYMEWYCGFGLVVTLIWLYVTILRLLALLARNR